MTGASGPGPLGGPAAYPVRVDAALEPRLSRWLWLVKWLLLIPHFVVLGFLWIAFVVLSVIAFFAILFTGRYPRALFDFNVGVLRWSWRVHYYGYAVLGTDRYPPFTLADVPDYPAHLDVDYPERLSRGLVLVKWWLLAIPHYIVVGLFVGGGLWASTSHSASDNAWWATGGLVGVLVIVAAVVLLFRGRYPESLYDFVMGMNRWVLRVAAYAGLMTDRYPPFRLDAGGADPGSLPVGPPPGGLPTGAAAMPPEVRAAAPQPQSRGVWTAGRVVGVVVGAVLVLASTGLFGAGGWLLWADRTQRDGAYLWTPSSSVSTSSYALTAQGIEFQGSGANWALERVVGTVRVQATAADPATALFVGVAPAADVERYLAGVPYARLGMFGRGMMTTTVNGGGGPPVTAPGNMDFWVAQASGTGPQSMQWQPTRGDWTVVVMRADGTRGVSATLQAAATLPAAGGFGAGLLAAGGLFLLVGVLIIAFVVPRTTTPPVTMAGPQAGLPAPRGPAPTDQPAGTSAGAGGRPAGG